MNIVELPFELRPYQHEAADSCLKEIRGMVKSIGLILPTGGGKTEVFIKICQEFLRENPNRSVLIMSHLSILTQQTFRRFQSRAPELAIGILQAEESPPVSAQVIISTMQSARIEDKATRFKFRAAKPVGLIIIDECHYMTCDSYTQALSYFPDVPVIGCTATPFKSSSLMTHYFDKIAYTMSLQDLIDMGYLVPPRLYEMVRQDSSLESIIAQMVSIYCDKEAGKKAIFFMQTIDDAKSLAAAFKGVGVNARSITSELVGDYRDSVLDGFSTGDIDVLTTVNVLTAGFDAPKVQAIFMPYATQSATQYLQRIGRGLRTCEKVGKSECRIYVFGEAPSVSKRLYQKLQNHVLNRGGKIREYNTFSDDLEYNDFDQSSEIYQWTTKIVGVVNQAKKAGLNGLSSMINEKRFPKKFLDSIDRFIKRLPKSKPRGMTPVPITMKQRETLAREGFTDIDGLSRYEASCLIASLFKKDAHIHDEKYVITSGRFAGRHLDDTAPSYRQLVMMKFPNSLIAEMIREWSSERESQGDQVKDRYRA